MERLRLPDGRDLAYDDVGDRGGVPVVWMPGLGDSRLARHPDDGLAADRGLRLISIDRPGYGGSSPQPNRSTIDTAHDVEHLADHLGLSAFAVAGWSLGGLHALAVAFALPDRVSRALIVDSLGLVDVPGGLSALHWTGSLPQRLRPLPPLQRAWFSLITRQVRHDVEAYLNGMARVCSEPDRDVLSTPEFHSMLAAEKREAAKQGPGGILADYNTASPLGFHLTGVTQRVDVFHGAQDTIVAPTAGRRLAQRLPNGRFHSIDPGGHLCFLTRWTELLDTLAAPAGAAAA